MQPQHVLRQNRDQAAEKIRPEERRADQDADADARDVGARQMRPLAVGEAAQHQLGDDGRDDRQRRPRRSFRESRTTGAPTIRMHVMRIGGRKPVVDRGKRRTSGAGGVAGAAVDSGSSWLLDAVQRSIAGLLDRLRAARRPADHDAVDRARRAQAVVQAPLVLRAEAAAAADFLHLPLAVPVQLDARADRAAVARRALELERDPVAPRLHGVLVDQQRTALVGDDDVEHAAVRQIGERDGAAVVGVGRADDLRHLGEAAGAVVRSRRACAGSPTGCGPLIAGQLRRVADDARCGRRRSRAKSYQ